MKTNRVSGVIVVWFVVIGALTITAAAIYVFSKHKHAFDYPAFCHEKLHNLSVALFAYQEAFGTFPPAFLPDAQGKPIHSWRVILLPYLKENGTKDLYDFYRFNEPWDGPFNKRFRKDYMPIAYQCPSIERAKKPFEYTHFVAVTGPGTAWPGDHPAKVTPGGKKVILVEYLSENIPWLEPRDISIDDLKEGTFRDNKLGIGSPHGGGPYVLFSDGSVERLPLDAPLTKLRQLALDE
jgi:prepilin-type processing-associated H-X9-DG protein